MSNVVNYGKFSQNTNFIAKDVDSKEFDLRINNYFDIGSSNRFFIHNRRYLGSKYKLCPFINWVYENKCFDIESVADIFAGTGVVAQMFNYFGKQVIVNDILQSNYLIYQTFFSDEKINYSKLEDIIFDFNLLNIAEENYFSQNFGDSFFTMENARKIGYIREEIDNMGNINSREKSILITSLIYATDKVANTCGHYDAYRRKLDTTQELKLLMPCIEDKYNKNNRIFKEDANQLVKKVKTDLVYIDTPYNSRQYGDAYHLLENLAEWKKPEVFGVVKKMKDRKKTKSKYCTVKATETFEDLITNINSKFILVSYNNMAEKGSGRSNAKISHEEIVEILSNKGDVEIFSSNYKAFTTGKSNINNHKELLYFCEVRD